MSFLHYRKPALTLEWSWPSLKLRTSMTLSLTLLVSVSNKKIGSSIKRLSFLILDSSGSKCFSALYNVKGQSCDGSCSSKLGWYGETGTIGTTIDGWFGQAKAEGDSGKEFQILERHSNNKLKTSGVDNGEKGCAVCMCEGGGKVRN